MRYEFIPPAELAQYSTTAGVLALIWQKADANGQAALSMGDIATALGTSREVINRIVRKLEEAGSIRVDAGRGCNVYTIARGVSQINEGSPLPAATLAEPKLTYIPAESDRQGAHTNMGQVNTRSPQPPTRKAERSNADDAPGTANADMIGAFNPPAPLHPQGPRIPVLSPETGFFHAQRARASADSACASGGARARAQANGVPPPSTPHTGAIQKQYTPSTQVRGAGDSVLGSAPDQESDAKREGTWLGNLPTIVREGWNQCSAVQRQLLRTLRNKATAAGVRGPHPAEPDWQPFVDELCRHEVYEYVAVVVAYLTDRACVAAAIDHLHAKAHRFHQGIGGALIFTAVAQDYSNNLRDRAQAARRLAARRAREEAERKQRALDEAAAEELKKRARVMFAALHPLGEAAIRRLIDRAAQRMDSQARNHVMSMLGLHARQMHSGAKNAPRSLLQAPRLMETAYEEFITHGPPANAATSAAQATG